MMSMRQRTGKEQMSNPYGHYGHPFLTHNHQDWEDAAVPDYIRNNIEDADNSVDYDNSSVLFTQLIQDIAGSFPIVGGIVKAFGNIGLSGFNKKLVESQNIRNQAYAAYQNWYNSPKQQIKRLRQAGLNPFMQSYVKSYPAADVPFENYVPSSFGPSTFAADLNALTNYMVGKARVGNLESLTDVNEYKLDNLLPQLFDKNGYINTILQLQVAWEEGNYDYERQLKQNILDVQYKISLANLAEDIMMLQPNVDGGRTIVNPDAGIVTYVNSDGSVLSLTDLPLKQWPVVLQTAFINNLSKQNLTAAQVDYYTQQANTSSALAALYNSRKAEVDLNVNTFNEKGVWPSDDIVLRAAAGITDWSILWKSMGYNTINSAVNTGLNIGSRYLLPKSPVSPIHNNSNPIPMYIPKGAKPYSVGGQTYYYYPYTTGNSYDYSHGYQYQLSR